ncbi:MAG: hypothetical protein LBP19_00020 [Treponema sp.]|jgi:hypothetical protein|nr:hypothetical protein [Treponema sp.]
MGVFSKFTPEFGSAHPDEGWQQVTVSEVEEDQINAGNDRITITITCENGAEVKYAHSVIMGYDWSNRTLTELLLAFHTSLEVKSPFALKGKSGEVYLWKVEGSDGKSFWKVRNMRVPEYGGKKAYETWYKKPVSSETHVPPEKREGKQTLARSGRGQGSASSAQTDDGFEDDIPF